MSKYPTESILLIAIIYILHFHESSVVLAFSLSVSNLTTWSDESKEKDKWKSYIYVNIWIEWKTTLNLNRERDWTRGAWIDEITLHMIFT